MSRPNPSNDPFYFGPKLTGTDRDNYVKVVEKPWELHETVADLIEDKKGVCYTAPPEEEPAP